MSIEIQLKEESDLNDPSTDTVFDLADCCRTCLRRHCSLTPTNSWDSDFIKFCDKLAACVSGMKWAKEGVPSFICGLCIEKLRIAYDFQIVCLQSDQALQLQGEASEIQCCKSATPSPATTTDLAECNNAIENVILSIKAEETQIKPLPECTPVTSAAAQLEAIQTSDNPCKDGCQACRKELCELIQRHAGKECFQCLVWLKPFMKTAELTAHMHTEEKCDTKFTESSNLHRHMKKHTGEKLSCKLCDKKFTWSTSLREHMKKHTGEKFSCKLCEKKFTQSSNLRRHMKNHTGEKFSCKLCDKNFTQPYLLRVHMKKHAEAKFSCQLCDTKFTESSNLHRHMKKHTGEKLSCKLCDKKFTWSTSLGEHMKKHTGEKFSCKLCDKRFTYGSALRVHMKKHAGEKFPCKLCDKRFTESSSLYVHMKKHTGEKFSCKLCDKEFAQLSSLSVHMKRHTDD